MRWLVVFCLLCGCLGSVEEATPEAKPSVPEEDLPLAVGANKQLFVDDLFILASSGVTRVQGAVVKHGVVLTPEVGDDPEYFGAYTTAHRSGNDFRLWFRTAEHTYGYATSTDGINFNRIASDIGLRGSGFSCCEDSNGYKFAMGHPQEMKACVGFSDDGVIWRYYNGGDPVTGRAADTHNQVLWDKYRNYYRLYTRQDYGNESNEVRGTRCSRNPDISADPCGWEHLRKWRFDDARRRQVYGLTCWQYCRVYFGLMSVYEYPGDTSEGGQDLHARHDRDILNFHLVTSRSGSTWDLAPVYASTPFIPRGGDGAFDKDMILPPSSIITHDDKHYFYYTGFRERHSFSPRKPSVGLATCRLDGFAALQAGATEGVVQTVYFKLEHPLLFLNIAAEDVAVEVVDADGAVAGYRRDECVLLQSIDTVRHNVVWQTHPDLSSLVGKEVSFKIFFRAGKLYSFVVREGKDDFYHSQTRAAR